MRRVDVLVVGGGITGLGVARLAARNGLGVALLERGDLASGTSSASSHMLHGGLRYLEHGRLGLVREALSERAAVSHMAPGVSRPHRFLVPVHRDGRLPLWRLRIGLALYDVLAGPRGLAPHATVRARETLALEPGLSPEGLVGAGIYSDVVMDDARLAVLVARDAAAHGASLHTYCEAAAARPAEGGRVHVTAHDQLSGHALAFETRVVVNAAGPWADAVRRRLLADLRPGAPAPDALLRPSRGIHLVYPPLTRSHGLLLAARRDRRVLFVVPLGEHALVGTTEIEVPSPPPHEAFEPSDDEIDYLRRELASVLPDAARLRPLAVTAGVRPLLASEREVGQASREHRVAVDGHVITVAGGKYTTFRVMARDALARAAHLLGRPATSFHDTEDLLPPPPAAGTDLERRVDHAVDHEHVRRVDDVLRRRTGLWLDPGRARDATPRIARRMAQRLGWDAARERDEIHHALEAREAEQRLIARAMEGA
jgi:glycerol-3-phosphate dehydrogenase